MKKILSISLVLLLATASLNAQEVKNYKHEISLSAGVGTTADYLEPLSNIFAISIGSQEFLTYGPSFNLQYLYNLNSTFAIGATASWQYGIGDFKNADFSGSWQEHGQSHGNVFSFMPTCKVYWFNRGIWGMYSKAAAGISYFTNTTKLNTGTKSTSGFYCFNGQLSLVGVEVGFDQFRAFAELGGVAEGTVLIGMKYNF